MGIGTVSMAFLMLFAGPMSWSTAVGLLLLEFGGASAGVFTAEWACNKAKLPETPYRRGRPLPIPEGLVISPNHIALLCDVAVRAENRRDLGAVKSNEKNDSEVYNKLPGYNCLVM